MPSYDTLCEVVAALDPELFGTRFAYWAERLRGPAPKRVSGRPTSKHRPLQAW